MTRAEVLAFLDRHQRSFSSREPAALAADHVADGVFESQAVGLVHGREAIEGVYRYWLTAFPDMAFTWRDPVIDGDRAALFWTFHGTMAGPFFGHTNPGARIEFHGAAEYELSPAGIVSARHVFDFTGALVAAGVFRIKPM